MRTAESGAVTATEAKALFSDLENLPVLVLAVSGGPDSIALMWLASRWSKTLKASPKLVAVTVDHGLRKESKREATNVARLARKLGIMHRTLVWRGRKPAAGLQQAARAARYRLLAQAARTAGANHVLTAHTLDDQAETVLIRMARGSGLRGLAAMQRLSVIPGREQSERTRNPYAEALRCMDSGPGPSGRPGMTGCPDALYVVRPLLDIPKARLIATLRAAKIPFAEDPSNRDPRFTRARFRALMPQFTREGLDARRLAQLARRIRRADMAIEATVDQAESRLVMGACGNPAVCLAAAGFAELPAEIALRLLGRAVTRVGNEGPVELSKLESLKAALESAQRSGRARFRRSLAGALVTLDRDRLTVERAPPRRRRPLTTPGAGAAKNAKTR